MPVLFGTQDPAVWRAASDVYERELAHFCVGKKAPLLALDTWVTETLPSTLSARAHKHLTKAELSDLMKWKLLKGKWRPALQAHVDSNSDADVQRVTGEAYAHWLATQDLKACLTILDALKGVGPATSTLILSVCDGAVPFMSDEALKDVCGLPIKYSVAEAVTLQQRLNAVATRLNRECEAGGTGEVWTAQRLQYAIWAACKATEAGRVFAPSGSGGSSGSAHASAAAAGAGVALPSAAVVASGAARPGSRGGKAGGSGASTSADVATTLDTTSDTMVSRVRTATASSARAPVAAAAVTEVEPRVSVAMGTGKGHGVAGVKRTAATPHESRSAGKRKRV